VPSRSLIFLENNDISKILVAKGEMLFNFFSIVKTGTIALFIINNYHGMVIETVPWQLNCLSKTKDHAEVNDRCAGAFYSSAGVFSI
jgi:hypothetical protein